MTLRRLLIANRGEIALRVVRACVALGIEPVTVFARDDATSGHVDERSWPLPGNGPTAYLDIAALLDVAARSGCDAVHPGYGFLSESAELAVACEAAGLVFVGPSPQTLAALGDKVVARRVAQEAGLPVIRATEADPSLAAAQTLLDEAGAVMVKAVGGGGGRGQRTVTRRDDLADALERCRSEATRSFATAAVYVEQLVPDARHIEVQLLGDGRDVIALGDRDCSVQRRRQKLIELAPAPGLAAPTRRALADAAVALGRHLRLTGAATVEFLVDGDDLVFLESNPRIQVEHTVTEEALGIDLVVSQLRIAGGDRLSDLGLNTNAARAAIQLRLNAEVVTSDALVRATSGTVTAAAWPADARVDTHVRPGLQVTGAFDSLLAKIVVSGELDHTEELVASAKAALENVRIGGVDTNQALLRALLDRPELATGEVTTTFVDDHLGELVDDEPSAVTREGMVPVTAPLAGVVVAVTVEPDDEVGRDALVVLLESMKMEHAVTVPAAGRIADVLVRLGDHVAEGQTVLQLEPATAGPESDDILEAAVDLDYVRPELAELWQRLGYTRDENRPAAVAKRHGLGRRTTRENLAQLFDGGAFVEYGALTVAAQRQRRELQDLLEKTPADGVICAIGDIAGVRSAVIAYDYTVLAGTQGTYGHRKQGRLLELAGREQLPVVIYAEGGGGRPGDTDTGWVAGLDDPTWTLLARLSGTAPIVAIVSGRSFAGNAALAGCADVLIATPEASFGMGGPAMIEGGGLGIVHPDEVGPVRVQKPNGVVDIVASDEAEATELARRLVSQLSDRRSADWTVADQRLLRHLVPESRSRSYDVRPIVETIADADSVIELRPDFGGGILTSLARIEGRPVGIVANNSRHLGGAIDVPAADKMARFLQLCDAHGLPVVSLCDTPGFMVGAEAEKTATVRHFGRLFVAGANLRVPVCFVALRKAYGLGAMAMAGGHLHAAVAAFAWPTGEFGPMGLEGGVRLGYRRELEAVDDPDERQQLFEQLVAGAYERGKAVNIASVYEIDGVIDPVDTRSLVVGVLAPQVAGPRRSFVDAW